MKLDTKLVQYKLVNSFSLTSIGHCNLFYIKIKYLTATLPDIKTLINLLAVHLC